MSSNHKKVSLSDSNSGFPLPAISEAFPSLLVWKATAASEAFFSPQLPTRGWKASQTAAVFFLFSCRYALRRQLQCSKMGAPILTLILLLTTFVHSSHQWTSHGSVLFFSEGESTLLEAPGDTSAGCRWTFTHSDTGHSCCFASHPYFCDRARNKLNLCREMADAKVNTEVSGVPGCTLALTDLSERRDKGNYKVTFPANTNQGLEVSLWIYPAPVPVTANQPVIVDSQGAFQTFCPS